jgi:hypothetical protein
MVRKWYAHEGPGFENAQTIKEKLATVRCSVNAKEKFVIATRQNQRFKEDL